MNAIDNILTQTVKVEEVQFLDEFDGIVTVVTTKGSLLSAYFWGDTFQKGEQANVQFSALDYPVSWDAIFSENKEQKLALETASKECVYYAYGRILSLNPIVVDFGDIKLSIGDWTHDERVIGEYIYWKIDRLDLTRLRTTAAL
jgi:hypothetical protein